MLRIIATMMAEPTKVVTEMVRTFLEGRMPAS